MNQNKSQLKQERLERIEKLIAQLRNCEDIDRIAELGQAEHDWLFANYKGSSAGTFISNEYIPAIITAFPPSPGDRLKSYESWQKVNSQWLKRHKVILTLMPTQAEWNQRNNPTKKLSSKKADDKLPLYPDPIITTAKELLSKDSWNKIAAGLILLTGRRPTEIAWCGDFKRASPYSLIFTGQLKKGEIESEPFEIPTLIEAESILNGFDRMRALIAFHTKIKAQTTPKAAATASNPQINQSTRSHFGKLLAAPPDNKGRNNYLSATNLRAAYGKIACYFYCPPSAEPILYTAKILGHQTNNYATESLATTIHYYTYYIVDKSGSADGATGICSHRLESSSRAQQVANNLEPSSETMAAHAINTLESNLEARQPETANTNESISLPNENKSSSEAIELEKTSTLESSLEAKEAEDNEEISTIPGNAKDSRELAQRLNKTVATIYTNHDKGKEHFALWSSQLDPDGLAWEYLGVGRPDGKKRQTTLFIPQASSAVPSIPDDAICGIDLAARLDCNPSTLGRNRDKGPQHFRQWTAKKDPDGISWQYLEKGQFGGSDYLSDIYCPIDPDNHGELLTLENDEEINQQNNPTLESFATQTNKRVESNRQLKDFSNVIATEKTSPKPKAPTTPPYLNSHSKENQGLNFAAPITNISLEARLCDRFSKICSQYNLTGSQSERFAQLLDLVESNSLRAEFNLEQILTKLDNISQQLGVTFELKITTKSDSVCDRQ